MVYDRRFRQIATTHPSTPWARRGGDLWNMTFGSSQRRPYCQHCFGSTHTSDQCCGDSDSATKGDYLTRLVQLPNGDPHMDYQILLLEKKSVSTARPMFSPRYGGPKICWQWNQGHCTFPTCQYIHACWSCHANPHLSDSNHKYVNCPRSQIQLQEAPVPPLMGNPSSH